MENEKNPREKEEFWNTITHGAGTFLALIASVVMITLACLRGTRLEIVSASIFGASLILLYSASTVYHGVRSENLKKIFRKVDHLCIYLLIAGTYTPITLLGLGGAWGWTLFSVIWGLVLIGFIFKFSPLQKSEKLSLSLYALMGWLAIVAIKPLLEQLEPGILWLILSGGICYTVGIYFYAKDQKPYYHAIWHVFVLGGSACHYFGILWYLIP